MDGDLGEILGGLAAALLVVALAAGLARLAGAAFGTAAPQDAEAAAMLRLLAVGTGGVFALALILAAPDRAIFRPGQVLGREGPWGAGLVDMLGHHVLPRAGALGALPDALLGADFLTAFLAWLALLGVVLGGVTALRLWQGAARRRAVGAYAVLLLGTALLLHAMAYLLAWLAAQLGPWLFALALLAFQRWRYARRAAH